jgi:hypothetical protein
LEKWDELDDLFEQCWKYKCPDHYEALADLVLVIHSCLVQANVDEKYQRSELLHLFSRIRSLTNWAEVLVVLDKIVKLTARQSGADMTKLARWLRCLFNLALASDEHISFLCTEQAVTLATKHHKVSQP